MWKIEYAAKHGKIFSFPNPDNLDEIICLKDGEFFECKSRPDFKGPGVSILSDGSVQSEPKRAPKEEPKDDEKIDESKEDEEKKPAEKKSKKKKKKSKGIGGKRIQ